MSRSDPAPGRRLAPDDPAVVAAIAAAVEAVWPRPVAVAEATEQPPAWRFSGRWWARPIAARRDRPWSL